MLKLIFGMINESDTIFDFCGFLSSGWFQNQMIIKGFLVLKDSFREMLGGVRRNSGRLGIHVSQTEATGEVSEKLN